MSALTTDGDLPSSIVKDGVRKRALFLGGCHSASLSGELRDDFDCLHLWRRPTIALMSDPPESVRPLDFDDGQSRLIMKDCTKKHLGELQSVPCEVLIFDLLRDVRTPLVRAGRCYMFDPDRMHEFRPEMPSPKERRIDVAALCGTADVERLDSRDPRFLGVWSTYFDRFYDVVVKARLSAGCVVVLQRAFFAKQTVPASDALKDEWDHCDFINALMGRMHHIASGYPGIRSVGIDEALYRTADDAPHGGPHIVHPVRSVFVEIATQVRRVVAA